MKDNNILCGMYDKTSIPNEKDWLKQGIVPDNVKEYEPVSTDMFDIVIMSRSDFPFRNENYKQQNYYGWYMLIPKNRELLVLNENNGSNMDLDMLKIKNEKGDDLIIKNNDIEYLVYGKFNVAKTSDNWSLKVVMNKI